MTDEPKPWTIEDDGVNWVLKRADGTEVVGFYSDGAAPSQEDAELIVQAPTLHERLLRSEQLNAELARMLKSLEWSGSSDGEPECPECTQYKTNIHNKQNDHFPDCALAALLKKARTE